MMNIFHRFSNTLWIKQLIYSLRKQYYQIYNFFSVTCFVYTQILMNFHWYFAENIFIWLHWAGFLWEKNVNYRFKDSQDFQFSSEENTDVIKQAF